MKIFEILIHCAAISGIACGIARADDWTHWRGPEQSGISGESGLAKTWSLETGENVLWTSDTGGRSTPIILNGRVFINCRTHHDVNDPNEVIHSREQIVCWDLYTGEELWRNEFNVFQTDIAAPRVGWASMCGDSETGNVYAHSVSGLLQCLDADGKVLWQHSLVEKYGAILGYGGRIQTPVIDEDRLIISFLAANWGESKGPGPMHYYYAFDKRTGELQWVSAPGGAPEGTNYSTPILTVINGQRLLIGGNGDGGVYAINARTGKPVWGFRMSKGAVNATPVVYNNRVYINHGADNIDNPEFGRVQCIDATGTGDITETGSVWRIDGIKADAPSPLVHDGVLYVVTDTGALFAYDAENGDMFWRHELGTVGKGSPVWADGCLFVTEVNGKIHTLRVSKDKCEPLNVVHLAARTGGGDDEIYASPAIADGRMIIVTRDRTICVGTSEAAKQSTDAMKLAEENPAGEKVALIQLRPYEVALAGGGKVDYELHLFDDNGRFIRKEKPDLKCGPGLTGAIENQSVTFPGDQNQEGTITASLGDMVASARVRVFSDSPVWKWDFEGLKGVQTPPAWLRAFAKIKPTEVDGNTAMKVAGMGQAKGRPSHTVWLGTEEMSDYQIQADVMMTEQRRQLSSIGLTNSRYTFLLRGNNNRMSVQSWQAHPRHGADQKFVTEPDVWYTMKLMVSTTEDQAVVKGKVWKRGETEPEEWSMEVVDPHPNMSGSPGLYVYAQTDCFFDNVKVEFAVPVKK